MSLADFAAQLQLDVDSILMIATFIVPGIVGTVQTLKVLQVTSNTQMVVLGVGGFLGALVMAGYFFPSFLPIGLVIYSLILATDSAVLGWKYLGQPVLSKLFPGAELTTSELAGE